MALNEAQAALCGIARYPNLRGTVFFTAKDCGTVVQLSVTGLPRGGCGASFFGLYIEEGCGCPPLRVRGGGVLPPVLNAGGIAVATFFTAGFRPEEVLGRRIVLAASAECFERGGGTPIASGVISPCACMPSAWPPAGCEPPRRPSWEEWPGGQWGRPASPCRPPCSSPCPPPCPPLFPPPKHCS